MIVTTTCMYSQSSVGVIPLPDSSGFTVHTITKDLGGGFYDHGVASPISNHRGVVSTIDGNGRKIVLAWLFDHRGGYALLMIDVETGKSEEFPIPFDPKHDTPYSSILSSDNKFYTLFMGHFIEFDPVKKAFTFMNSATPQMAMAMTEDDEGKIWGVTYPNSGLISFDPKTRNFIDYKSVNSENWRQYHKTIVADDSGWIYFGLGSASSQIFAFDPKSRNITPMLPQNERKLGMALVYRDMNGKVYGQALGTKEEEWYEFYKGAGRKIGDYNNRNPKPIITNTQNLFHNKFPDGTILKSLDLVNRILVTENPSGNIKEMNFNYSSDGAIVMGIGRAPDGTIAGGTAFPMRFFNYDLKKDRWINRKAIGQFNALVNQGNKVLFSVYSQGYLIEWDPFKPWIETSITNKASNPQFLTTVSPTIIRPFRLISHPDGKTAIMGGTPQYGATGGGLLFWDNEKKTKVLLKDSNVVLNQSSISLVPLPDNMLLGGTTTTPGSGGEKKAKEAVVYLMDLATKKIRWQKALFPDAQEYTEMRLISKDLVYGIVDKKTFFVFDVVKKEVVHKQHLVPDFGPTTAEQSPRVFVIGPNGEVYLLFRNGHIVEVEPKTYKLKLIATAPGKINAGGDYADGRIFFVSGSHLYSYKLK